MEPNGGRINISFSVAQAVTLAALIVQLAVAIFAYGRLVQKVDDIEKRIDRVQALQQNQNRAVAQ